MADAINKRHLPPLPLVSGSDLRDAGQIFMDAVCHGDLDKLKSLVARGWGVNRVNLYEGRSALFYAALYDQTEIARFLIQSGVTMDRESAALLGDTDALRDLLDVDANIDKNKRALASLENLLMLAASKGHTDTIRQLLERGADVNPAHSYEVTALIRAVQNDHVEAVRLLLKAGADVKQIPYNGEVALMHVHSAAVARLLLEHGADVNAAGSKSSAYSGHNQTPLMSACYQKDKALIPLLLAWGADIHARDGRGVTVLMNAASRCPSSQVQILLDVGGDLHLQDEQGTTALMWALSEPPDRIEDWRFFYGGLLPLDTPDDLSLVCEAIETEWGKTVELLIDCGADINVRDHTNSTPLHGACKNFYCVCTETLLRHHADVNARDSKGRTPLDHVLNNAIDSFTTPFQVQYRASQRMRIVPLLRNAGGKTGRELSRQPSY